VRHDLAARAIAGFDVDYSPGMRREWRSRPCARARSSRTSTRGDLVYDYDVTFWSASPYVQLEAAPFQRLRVVGGLRYDAMGYDYGTALEPTQTGSHRRPADASVDYAHTSARSSARRTRSARRRTSSRATATASARRRSRSSSGQGRALSSLDLKPVLADNFEVGARGRIGERVGYELAAYHMRKTGDLISFTRDDGSTETVNAGETLHRGIEAGLVVALPADLRRTRATRGHDTASRSGRRAPAPISPATSWMARPRPDGQSRPDLAAGRAARHERGWRRSTSVRTGWMRRTRTAMPAIRF
jgi:iron complex outermembrane recepter protein